MNKIIDISFQENLSHIGSCLTTYPILRHIYTLKKENDSVVLSNGHAGLALYVILSELYGHDPIKMLHEFGIHPVRDISRHVEVSSGSLGSAILVSVGMALAQRENKVFCIISDGECAEGSVWEALAFAHKNNLDNLEVHVNMNGYSAYDPVNTDYLIDRLKTFLPTIKIWKTQCPDVDFLNGLKAHYHVLSNKDKDYIDNKININEETVCSLIT